MSRARQDDVNAALAGSFANLTRVIDNLVELTFSSAGNRAPGGHPFPPNIIPPSLPATTRLGYRSPLHPFWETLRFGHAGADHGAVGGGASPTAAPPPRQREPFPWPYSCNNEALRHVNELQDLVHWCANPTGDLSEPTKQFLFDSVIPMILNHIDEVHTTIRGQLCRHHRSRAEREAPLLRSLVSGIAGPTNRGGYDTDDEDSDDLLHPHNHHHRRHSRRVFS